jgi:hypothetical protein
MAKRKNNSKEYIQFWADGCSIRPCVADYITTVSSILHQDYRSLKCSDFDDIYAWDADGYERKKYGANSSETVDMVFGLGYGDILMVEAKLDVKNVDNIKGEVEAKVKHTSTYLVSSINLRNIIRPSIVLFGTKNFQQLYTRFRKMCSNTTDIVPMRLNDFYKKFFVISSCAV